MFTKSNKWLSFISLVIFVLVVTNCGGGGGGGDLVPSGEKLVSLSTVTALYPVNGANWNDYVKGASMASGADTLCTAATDTACMHGGEKRVVTVTGRSSCSGITATDTLGVFDWTCDASTGTAQFISTGLKEGKYLSDLLDFSTPGWKANSVTVAVGTKLYSTATSTTWWSNPVVADNDGLAAAQALSGTIYVITASAPTATYVIDQDKVGLVIKPGVTLKGMMTTGEAIISASAANFLWLEGKVDATGDNLGVYLSGVNFSSLRNVQGDNADTGTWQAGIEIKNSSHNNISHISAAGNGMYGIEFSTSNYNKVVDIASVNNGGRGVALGGGSSNNIFRNVTVANNVQEGLYLVNYCVNNTFMNVVATSQLNQGIYINMNSDNNLFLDVTAALNQQGSGIQINTSKNTIMNFASIRNGTGLAMVSGERNTFVNIASADGGWDIYSVGSSTNFYSGLLKVGPTGCYETGGTDPGIVNGTCANNGVSNVVLTTGITLGSAVQAKVTVTDTANASNTNGMELYESIDDWTSFSNVYRTWGMDGSAFPNYDNAGRCTTGSTCRIWDWSLVSGDTVIKNVLSLPTGTSTLTHTWFDASTTTFLRNAVELAGNGNGLCESGETCLYTPNIGAYQGHGDLISAGAFTDGTITGVMLMKYVHNGR